MIDTEKLLKKSKNEIVKTMLDEVEALDQRRQKQIKNQVGTINRLMSGATVEEELARLHDLLATAESRLEAAQMEIRALRGETTSAYDLGVSKEA